MKDVNPVNNPEVSVLLSVLSNDVVNHGDDSNTV